VQTINAAWEFTLEEDNKTQIVNIPHTWNAEDAFAMARSIFVVRELISKTFLSRRNGSKNALF
jgi:beta-galactosidase